MEEQIATLLEAPAVAPISLLVFSALVAYGCRGLWILLNEYPPIGWVLYTLRQRLSGTLIGKWEGWTQPITLWGWIPLHLRTTLLDLVEYPLWGCPVCMPYLWGTIAILAMGLPWWFYLGLIVASGLNQND